MYREHFGLKFDPLGKRNNYLETTQTKQLSHHLTLLLQTCGIGIISGEAGVGKTSALRQWCTTLNPLTHQMFYQSDNHFRGFDIYAQLAEHLGLARQHRYSQLWRSLKSEIMHLHSEKKITPVWILDEADQLPDHFFATLPTFLNFSFDTQDLMIIILLGSPKLEVILRRKTYAALSSRVQFLFQWVPIEELDVFKKFIESAFNKAGCIQPLFTDSGIQLIHHISKGRLRDAHRIITRSLQLAADQKLHHVPDSVVDQSIEQFTVFA